MEDVIRRVRPLCLALPETYEEQAWVGTRWLVRKRNFAHVLEIEGGRPQAYGIAAATDGPVTVMTFRSSGLELDALIEAGPPFFKVSWGTTVMGMAFSADTDWTEVAELLAESYRFLAPQKLVKLLEG